MWSGRPSLWLREKFSNIAPNDTGIFKLAKQMDKTNQDVVGEKCVRNDAGELSLSDEEKMKAWVEHYARLMNVEFEWESDLLLKVLLWKVHLHQSRRILFSKPLER